MSTFQSKKVIEIPKKTPIFDTNNKMFFKTTKSDKNMEVIKPSKHSGFNKLNPKNFSSKVIGDTKTDEYNYYDNAPEIWQTIKRDESNSKTLNEKFCETNSLYLKSVMLFGTTKTQSSAGVQKVREMIFNRSRKNKPN